MWLMGLFKRQSKIAGSKRMFNWREADESLPGHGARAREALEGRLPAGIKKLLGWWLSSLSWLWWWFPMCIPMSKLIQLYTLTVHFVYVNYTSINISKKFLNTNSLGFPYHFKVFMSAFKAICDQAPPFFASWLSSSPT